MHWPRPSARRPLVSSTRPAARAAGETRFLPHAAPWPGQAWPPRKPSGARSRRSASCAPLREISAQHFGVFDEMFAQFLQLAAELALLRRHYGDRRGNIRLRRFRRALDANGCDDAGPSGIGADTDASPRLFVPATRGAMIAFSTLVELQTGQLTSPRLT